MKHGFERTVATPKRALFSGEDCARRRFGVGNFAGCLKRTEKVVKGPVVVEEVIRGLVVAGSMAEGLLCCIEGAVGGVLQEEARFRSVAVDKVLTRISVPSDAMLRRVEEKTLGRLIVAGGYSF